MATIKIVLDQRRRKKNETFPVVLRIRHKDRYFDIKTNYSIHKNLFDEKKQLILGNMDANFNIEEQKEKYSKRIREFLKENINSTFDINILKRYVLQKPAELTTIEEFWKEVIQQLLDSNRTGTAKSYITTLSVISKIIDCNCMFSQVSYKDLIIIETTLLKRGVSVNGIAVYMRTFRAICNRAILYNVATLEWYPFRKYKIKKEKTTPRTISIIEMQKYFAYNIDNNNKLYKSWCIGKLIFMLRGINLTDLLLLKKSNLHNDRIIYKRAKTGKMYSVKMLPQVQELINEFKDDTQYLFGNLMEHFNKVTLVEIKQYADFRKKLNKKLKKISKLVEIETPITTYVFRYSYANIGKQLGYSKDLIAEALGHEYGNSVTGIYLEMFDNDIIDMMNENIIKSII
ncbi:phage integrase SAM-like domain-containing protein [Flavobacterium chungnamense]|uniref:Site-specific integrase n=1 Tax=Flavobacterium chungnamense TaxID=706182 RepID=A0ABP7V267_9FLAO